MRLCLCFTLQGKFLPCQILTHVPELSPIISIPEVGVQFVVGDCILVEVRPSII